ncbi:hypothetical protein TREPR_0031 [Treponema primitia ZAS-2]|uniref:Uncharacterized protein n=1 Tax=Treponema primitia (strain ATCC BAA-887 / DSM 12427 / ZAS-2) TaxID=545694 RepID=F5YNX8_TREPZ|nr:hypothetical protein [Treponema primitia]AEF85111.1 hypothetical protein TREPR_0031 [Treponema primitia ZAS-2]
MFLDLFKKNIINQIVAADDGRVLHSPVEPYFHAFTGEFSQGMPFTFYFEEKNKPIMFVYDSTPIDRRSSHALFLERCEEIKVNILPITNFIQKLTDDGYVTVRPLDFTDRPELPPDYANLWRKYKQFYSDVMNGLSFACFSRFVPEQKLYDVWIKFNPKVLAG